jgi:hypothetical protein
MALNFAVVPREPAVAIAELKSRCEGMANRKGKKGVKFKL